MADSIFTAITGGDLKAVKAFIANDPKLVGEDDGKSNRPLHYAAAGGHLEVAKLLLEQGAEVNGGNKDWEWRPIVYASWNNHVEMVRFLIEMGADVTRSEGQPIHYAGQKKHKKICRILAENGAIDDLSDPPDPDATAFFRAAYSFDATVLSKLLVKNPGLTGAQDTAGRTALHEAGTNGAAGVIRVLLEAGVDVNLEDDSGRTAIQRAALHRQPEACLLLKDGGASVDILTACHLGWADDVRRIVENDPAQASVSRDGTPLIESVCEAGWLQVGKVLVESGAPVDIFTACSLGMHKRVEQFLERDPSLVGAKRRLFEYEPLHCGAECGHPEVVELLLEAGADVNGCNGWKFTPLHLAVIGAREQRLTEAHFQIARLLIERGANVTAVDEYHRSPLDLANGNIDYGREHGEDLTLYKEVRDFIQKQIKRLDPTDDKSE